MYILAYDARTLYFFILQKCMKIRSPITSQISCVFSPKKVFLTIYRDSRVFIYWKIERERGEALIKSRKSAD